MADLFGDLGIPAPAPAAGEPVADRPLVLVGNYLKTFLNTYGQTAWDAVQPPQVSSSVPGPTTIPVVREVFTHDPQRLGINEKHLPALFIQRAKGERAYWMAEDYRISDDKWTIWWVFRKTSQDTQKLRDTFARLIVQYIDRAIEKVRDPAHVVAGDTDPTAATIAAIPAAIKASIATSVTAQNYTGAALNGAVGDDEFSPARHLTITVGGDDDSIVDGSIVTANGLGSDGSPRTASVTIVKAEVPGTFRSDWSLTKVDTIDVPAQAGTAATLTFGLEAFTGKGSVVMRIARLQKIELTRWTDKVLPVRIMKDSATRGLETLTYDAVEIEISVEEKFEEDISVLGDAEALQQFTTEDGFSTGEASFT